MALDGLLTYINTLFPVGPSLVKALNERIILTEFKKGDIIASPGRRADEIWFIAKGLAKEFHLEQSGKTVITTFWKENELMLIADSFFQKHRSDRYIHPIAIFN